MKVDKQTLVIIGLLIISPALFPLLLIADYLDKWNQNNYYKKGRCEVCYSKSPTNICATCQAEKH
jgi:hypothetical protein